MRGEPTVTYSGRLVWPLSPRLGDVHVPDIAHGLSLECRYGNQTLRHYSVAEHSVLLSLALPEPYRKEGLFHDGDEFVIPDLPHGIKHSTDLVFYAAMEEYRQAGKRWQATIFERLGIESTEKSRKIIKEYDNRIVLDETTVCSPFPGYYKVKNDLKDLQPLGVNIQCWSPRVAEFQFLQRFRELFQ